MSADAKAEPAVPVRPGMLLIGPGVFKGPTILAVKSVRKTPKGCTATIIGASPTLEVEATVKFPGAVIREPWRVWYPSTPEVAELYARLAPAEAPAP